MRIKLKMMKKLALFTMGLFIIAAIPVTLYSQSVLAGSVYTDAFSDDVCKESEQGAQCADSTEDQTLNVDCRTDGTSCNPVTKYLNPLINALAIFAGIAVVIGIIVGGIQYSSSGGDPQKAAAGKKHIKMAIIALVGFFFLYTFLQFLLPGGVIQR
jgi:hypothetical protein